MKKAVRLFSMVMAAAVALVMVVSAVSPSAAAISVSSAKGSRDWQWPVRGYTRISSYFNESRSFTLNGKRVNDVHVGLDIPARSGADVLAAYAGTVVVARSSGSGVSTGWGKYVKIEHSYGGKAYYSIYGHCSSINVSVGDRVSAGQVIAGAGTTGSSTGVHLHFEVSERESGKYVDPFMNEFLALPGGLAASSGFSSQGYINRVKALYEGGGNGGGPVSPPDGPSGGGATTAARYFPRYTGNSLSITDALKAVGAHQWSSYERRCLIAASNSISNYRGSSQQNLQMLALLKSGTLRIPD